MYLPPTSSPTSHDPTSSPAPKPPLTWGDQENPEHLTLCHILHFKPVATPMAGRTALFLENWARLTQDPWVLSTVRGYQIPLEHWPEKHWSTITVREEQQSVLQVAKLREKETVFPVQQTEAHIISPVFVVPKSGGGWRLITDLRYLNSVPPHFKMEGLFMLPSVISQGRRILNHPYGPRVLESS